MHVNADANIVMLQLYLQQNFIT